MKEIENLDRLSSRGFRHATVAIYSGGLGAWLIMMSLLFSNDVTAAIAAVPMAVAFVCGVSSRRLCREWDREFRRVCEKHGIDPENM